MVAPARMYEDEHNRRKGPGLAISRCIGDLNARRCGLIATPRVIKVTLDPSVDSFVILASDGVWEFITPEFAVELVAQFRRKGMRAIDACKWLIANAAAQWRAIEGDYRDDITAIVIWVDEVTKNLTEAGSAQSPSKAEPVNLEQKAAVRRFSVAFS